MKASQLAAGLGIGIMAGIIANKLSASPNGSPETVGAGEAVRRFEPGHYWGDLIPMSPPWLELARAVGLESNYLARALEGYRSQVGAWVEAHGGRVTAFEELRPTVASASMGDRVRYFVAFSTPNAFEFRKADLDELGFIPTKAQQAVTSRDTVSRPTVQTSWQAALEYVEQIKDTAQSVQSAFKVAAWGMAGIALVAVARSLGKRRA